MSLTTWLTQLENAQLVRQTPDDVAAYIFKHVLTQESAYASLLKENRKRLHHAVAQTYEALYPTRLDEFAGLLAQHFAEAGEDAKALEYFGRAGEAALRVFANVEAFVAFQNALELARRADPRAAGTIRELFLKRGRALELCGRFVDALANYKEMEAEGRAHADAETELAAVMAQATIHSIPTEVGDAKRANELAQRGLELARQIGKPSAEAKILWSLMLLNSRLDTRYQQALQYGEQSLALARANGLHEQEAYDLNDLAMTYVSTGHRERAMETLLQARQYWIAHKNLPMLTDNLGYEVMIHIAIGEYDKAIAPSREAFELSQQIGDQWGMAFSQMWIGTGYAEMGLMEDALKSMTNAIEFAKQSGFGAPFSIARVTLANLYGELGQVERGIELGELAAANLTRSADIGSILIHGYLVRLYLMAGQVEYAESLYRQNSMLSSPDRPPLPFGALTQVVETELLLGQKNYSAAVARAAAAVEELRRMGLAQAVPILLMRQAEALRAQDKLDDAFAVLVESHSRARAMNARWRLWRIESLLAEIETSRGHLDSANSFYAQARADLEFVLAHIPADLRETFSALPAVRAVIQPPR